MYTRVVEITSKSGKARELCDTIDEKVVPVLKKQTGFVDETVLCRTRNRIESSGSASGTAKRMPSATIGSNTRRSMRR